MKLSVRLASSYLVVILFFLISLAVFYMLLGGGEVLEQLHKDALAMATRLADSTARKAERSGWPAAAEMLAETPLIEGTSVVLFHPHAQQLQGDLQPAAEGPLKDAWRGRTTQQLDHPADGARRRLQLWLPVGKEAVLWLSVPVSLSESVRQGIGSALTQAALLASGVAFLAGLWMSRSISRPVQRLAEATERLGREELTARVQVQGGDELADLAADFNRMAGRLEESQERLRRQTQQGREFLADVSHNLKTPLAAILGWTEALQDGLVPGQEAATLERIHRQVGFISRTVQRLLDLSRYELGEVGLRLETLDPLEPLMEAVEALADAAEARQVELQLEGVRPGLRVLADRVRLRELIQVCLENAVYHAGDGARVEVHFQEGERLEIAVVDDGVGLPEGTDLAGRDRTGLGVAIAHKLAAAHGGELALASRPGQGTRVSFTVARAPSEGAPA